MTLETYLLYLVTVLVFFIHPPGPSQMLFIAHSMRHKVERAMPTLFGDLSANSIQILIAGFGLAGLVQASASFFLAVKWMGVAYLVWLGIKMIWSTRRPDVESVAKSQGSFFKDGFITSAANPYAVVFFAALFPQFIDPTQAVLPQVLILGATYLVIDGVILLLMGYGAEKLVRLLKGSGTIWMSRLSGACLLIAAFLLAGRDLASDASGVRK
jgi:threonine/homoserine/homoserine lactone efflux protein